MKSASSKRILIVDDNIQARMTHGHWLAGEGHHVTPAGDGLEALSLYQQNRFDLVIIELLPGTNDGFDTFIKLHSTSTPPKLIATVKPSRMEAAAFLRIAKQLGADETLAKPFTAGELLAAVEKVLRDDRG